MLTICYVSQLLSINIHGVKPLKDKKSKTVLNAVIEIVNKSNRKPNKLWIDKEREFYIHLCKNFKQ